jgi:hypothetical protein
MKRANLPPVQVDLSKVSEKALENFIQQGAKYFIDAHLSHKAGKDVENPDFGAIVQEQLDRFYAPEWVSRARGEAGEDSLTLEEKALVMALEPRFAKAGATWRANKKAGKDSRTVLDVVDELGGEGDDAYEQAARKVATDYLTKQGMDSDRIPAAVDASWKKIQAEAKQHLASLKLKASNGKGNGADF